MRRVGFALAACALLVLPSCSRPAAARVQIASAPTLPVERRPNVLLIVADDLAWTDVSTYGRTSVRTPNLERIASSGVAFSNGYAAAPVCAVSRAALLTGRAPQDFGFMYNLDDDADRDRGLPLDQPTLADRLKTLGYRTGAIGKWHLGYTADYYPTRRGFDEFYGFVAGKSLYADLDTPGIVTTRTPADRPLVRRQDSETVTGPDAIAVDNHQRYLTDDFTGQAVDFIDRGAAAGSPFFLYLAYSAPHWPMQAPQVVFDRYADIEDPIRRTYVAMIAVMDEGIGRVLDALEQHGLREDTLIVFVSDNGCPAPSGACDCSHPLGAGKFTHLEGGLRVPFLFAWPRALALRGVVATPVSTLDVVATVLRAAAPDEPAPGLAGLDLVGLAQADSGQPDRTLLWGQYPVFAARTGRWKLWESADRRELALYDLEADLGEQHDVSAKHPEIVRTLDRQLDAWRRTWPAPLWRHHSLQIAPLCAKTTQWVY